MAAPVEIKLDKKDIRELEKLILTRVENIIFKEHKRPSGLHKVEGGLLVEDKTGDLRRKLKANRNFVKQGKGGSFEITLNMVSYYKYLDDTRRNELNWYFSEAIFEDKKIIEKLRELMAGAAKRTIIKVVSEEPKP